MQGDVAKQLKGVKKSGRIEKKREDKRNSSDKSKVPLLRKRRSVLIWEKQYRKTAVSVSKQGVSAQDLPDRI